MATITIDFDLGFLVQEITLSDSTNTLIFDPPQESSLIVLKVIQGAGIGAKLATWPSEVQWAGGLPPVLSISAGDVDVFDFVAINNGTAEEPDFEYYGRVFAQDLL